MLTRLPSVSVIETYFPTPVMSIGSPSTLPFVRGHRTAFQSELHYPFYFLHMPQKPDIMIRSGLKTLSNPPPADLWT